MIESQIAASPYLSRLLEESSISLDEDLKLLGYLESICDSLVQSEIDDLNEGEAKLLQAKTDFAFAWSLAELSRQGTQAERGLLQTRFAEVSIDYALRLAWLSVGIKQKALQSITIETLGRVPGLFIFGMGKLGGNDLNFSSDVDLVAYFDPSVLPVPDMLGKSYVCHQVLQSMTKLLGQGGQSNFVWRVDWRLRPNASATSLAMSVVAAEQYYFYQASPWHRLALMKARVVAGDESLGKQFLQSLAPFIWRQNLDYRALDELAEIKQRINLEHPALRAQRQWREPIVDEIAGFNVKLGSGGIREIEFIANALQLVWGGRIAELRVPNTVEALRVLAERKRIQLDDSLRLIDCYQLLRKVENAIQILGNQQTHLIPSSQALQQGLLVLLDITTWAELVTLLNSARRFVSKNFDALFADQGPAKQEPIVWPEGLTQQADDIVEAWEAGYYIYGVSNQVRHRLVPLTRGIASYLAEDEEQVSESASDTIVRLHDFFRSLPSGEQYFRLLAESPALLRSIVPPLLHSLPMTVLLQQSPHIIDCYVEGDWRYPQPFDSQYVLQTDDYGEQLERMRRFVNEYLYQLYLSFSQGALSVVDFQLALSSLAEHSLELALQVVCQNMGLKESPITVIGMGKVALRRMSPLSDLDLIFLFDQDDVSLDLASRFVSRLQTAISTPMREGILYELDTRLRPSGRSGAPTVSIDSFANHHNERAHTWEHIALMPSRVVAGSRAPEARINSIKRRVVSTSRNQDQFLRDAAKMWHRIAEHRVKDTPLQIMNSKLRVGGLMQAEYLAACLILQNASSHPISSLEFDSMLAQCLTQTDLAGTGLEELPEIIQFWRIQQLWERLLGKTEASLSNLRDRYFSRLLEHSNVNSMDELLAKKKRYVEIVDSGLNDLFSDLRLSEQEIDEWVEEGVKWS